MIPVSIVVYWMMILWLKQILGNVIPDKCVNSGLLNDDILIKTNVSKVVYWMMIFWLKQSDTCVNGVYWMMIFWLKQNDTCVNSGLLNDDILIKTKWYLEIKTKWYLC